MRRLILGIAGAAALLAGRPAPLAAQEGPVDLSMTYQALYDGEAERRGQRNADFGFEPAEALAARGEETYRIFIWPVLVLTRRPGQGATVTVTSRAWTGEGWTIRSLTGRLTSGQWRRLSTQLDAAAASVAASQDRGASFVYLCIDGATTFVEAASRTGVVRTIEPCTPAELWSAGVQVGFAAFHALPQCEDFVTPQTQVPEALSYCAKTEGDPVVAAAAWRLVGEGRDLSPLFGASTQMEIGGGPVLEGPAALAAWQVYLEASQAGPLHVEGLQVVSGREVRLRGHVTVSPVRGEGTQMATFDLRLTRGASGAWRLERAVIGPPQGLDDSRPYF